MKLRFFTGGAAALATMLACAVPALADVVTINFTAPVTATFGIANPGTIMSGTISYDPTLATYTSFDSHSGMYLVPGGTFSFGTNSGFSLIRSLTGIFVDDSFSHPGYQFVANVGTPFVTPFSSIQLRLNSFNSSSTVTDTSIPTSLNLANFTGSEIFYDAYVYNPTFAWVGQIEHCCGSYDISVNLTMAAAAPEPATWAMMLLGFAGIGFVAYRRRRLVLA